MRALRFARRRSVRTAIVEFASGCTRKTNTASTVLTVGREPSVDYFLQSFFTDKVNYSAAASVSWNELPEFVNNNATSNLSIIRCDRSLPSDGFAPNQWRMPDAVASVVDLSGSGGPAPSQKGNTDNLRRIRKYGLYATLSRDSADLIDFYHNAYLPFISDRFGELGISRSESQVARYFRKGGLLWVECEGVRLAAMVFSMSGRVARSCVIAPLRNQPNAVRFGAVSATYKFLIDLARAEDCTMVHLGMSRPHLLDGVLIHKKHWGARLVDVPEVGTDLLLAWKVFSPDIADWLFRTPLVVRDLGGLSALTSLTPDISNADYQRHLLRLSSPGLNRILVIASPDKDFGVTSINGLDVCWLDPWQASACDRAS